MSIERRLLQIAVAGAGFVPVLAGLVGAVSPGHLDLMSRLPQTQTHAAYLSGLLLGIGLSFWSLVPAIERQGRAFGLLTGIVALGGLARVVMAMRLGVWTAPVALPLIMELGVTPALWLWQRRIARIFARA